MRARGMSSGISVAVLCGGRSTRFGADKASALVGGQPLVSHVVERLRRVTDDIFLQGGPPQEVPPGVRACPDLVTGRGPLSGVHGALANAAHPRVLVVGCDMPGVDPRLARVLGRDCRAVDAAVPTWHDGKIEPLCALYSRTLLPVAARMLEEGEHRISHLLRPPARARLVPIEPLVGAGELDAGCFVNINTRADLARWESAHPAVGLTGAQRV